MQLFRNLIEAREELSLKKEQLEAEVLARTQASLQLHSIKKKLNTNKHEKRELKREYKNLQ